MAFLQSLDSYKHPCIRHKQIRLKQPAEITVMFPLEFYSLYLITTKNQEKC